MRTINALLLLVLLSTASGCKWITAAFHGEKAGPGKLICHIDASSVLGQPVSSPDSRHVAYVTKADAKRMVTVDGKEEKPYDFINVPSIIFSPDSKRVAYVASIGGKQHVVVGGKDESPYNEADYLIFSPDSRRLAYMARDGGKWLVVVDGKEEKAYDLIAGPSIAFSPDSSRVGYLARDGEHWVAVVDGKESKPYDDARGLTFSSDSRHVAYVANIDGKAV
ncbi:MAG TPA: hypothetical protein VKF63_06610, partial [Terracidiphilus sp.]|nr:hypothetical protein [Terracidiphilus sp.]